MLSPPLGVKNGRNLLTGKPTEVWIAGWGTESRPRKGWWKGAPKSVQQKKHRRWYPYTVTTRKQDTVLGELHSQRKRKNSGIGAQTWSVEIPPCTLYFCIQIKDGSVFYSKKLKEFEANHGRKKREHNKEGRRSGRVMDRIPELSSGKACDRSERYPSFTSSDRGVWEKESLLRGRRIGADHLHQRAYHLSHKEED